MAKDRTDDLFARFLSDTRRAHARTYRMDGRRPPHCRRCGESTDVHHSRWGECHVCDFTGRLHAWDMGQAIDLRLQDIVWKEAVAARKRRAQTPRQFFGSLRLAAKIALMRELRAREQAASAEMGRVTPTMRWLRALADPIAL